MTFLSPECEPRENHCRCNISSPNSVSTSGPSSILAEKVHFTSASISCEAEAQYKFKLQCNPDPIGPEGASSPQTMILILLSVLLLITIIICGYFYSKRKRDRNEYEQRIKELEKLIPKEDEALEMESGT